MPKNKGKGGKRFRKGAKGSSITEAGSLPMATDTQHHYATVQKALGDRRFLVHLPNGLEILAHVPGKMRKRVWITANDVVLVEQRECDPSTYDILYKYTAAESKLLKQKGCLQLEDSTQEDDSGVVFDDDDTICLSEL